MSEALNRAKGTEDTKRLEILRGQRCVDIFQSISSGCLLLRTHQAVGGPLLYSLSAGLLGQRSKRKKAKGDGHSSNMRYVK